MMKYIGLLFMLLMMVACGRKSVPVSFTETSTQKKDSTSSVNTTKQEKIISKDSLAEKTLPGAKVGVTLTKQAFDSLIRALGNSPKGTTIIYQDNKLRAQLSFKLDSLGNIVAQCVATEQKYFDRFVKEQHYNHTLIDQISKVNTENQVLRETVAELQKKWYQKAGEWILKKIAWLLGIVLLGLAFMLYIKYKL